MATIQELKEKASLVANATAAGENTAARVGGALQDAAELLEKHENGMPTEQDIDNWNSLEGRLEQEETERAQADTQLGALVNSINQSVTNLNNELSKTKQDLNQEQQDRVKAERERDTVRFDGFVDAAEIEQVSTTEHDAVIFVRSDKKFAARKDGTYSSNWGTGALYMDNTRQNIHKDKVYIYNGKVYVWDYTKNDLVEATATAGGGGGANYDNEIAALQSADKRKDIEVFEGFIEDGVIQQSSASLPGGRVMFHEYQHLFVYWLSGKIYRSWNIPNSHNSDMYNDNANGTPYTSKVYLCKGSLYYYDNESEELYPIKANLTQEQEKRLKVPVISHQASEANITIQPNTEHLYNDAPTAINVTLGAVKDATVETEYRLCFKTGNTVPTVTFPSNVKFPSETSFKTNKYYEVSIGYFAEGGIYPALVAEWTL